MLSCRLITGLGSRGPVRHPSIDVFSLARVSRRWILRGGRELTVVSIQTELRRALYPVELESDGLGSIMYREAAVVGSSS